MRIVDKKSSSSYAVEWVDCISAAARLTGKYST